MCGIIAYSGPRLAAPILVEGLRRLEYRGYDSAGVALLDPQRTPIAAVTRSEGKIAALAAKLEAEPPSGTTGIGHNLAIPHGKTAEIETLCGLFARLDQPIDFDSVDDRPVGRNVELVRRGAAVVRVVDLPPPLVTNHDQIDIFEA